MNWEEPIYAAPSNLTEDVPPKLIDKPIATIHEIIRKSLVNYKNPDVSTTWLLNRVQKIILNTPNFHRIRESMLEQGSSFTNLREEVKRLVYSNLSLPKVPNRRKVVQEDSLLRISENCEFYICADKRTISELEKEYSQVEVIEWGRIDVRLVIPGKPLPDSSIAWWNDRLESDRETRGPIEFLTSVWDDNKANETTGLSSDKLRHYKKIEQLDVIGIESRIRRSFEDDSPLDGWQTTNAILAHDSSSDHAFGLAYNPDQNFRWGSEGWSISKWKIGDSWPEEPRIRHITKIAGKEVNDLGGIFDIMRAIRCTSSPKVNVVRALETKEIGWDLPYSIDSSVSQHSYWLGIARALYATDHVPRSVPISIATELFVRSGWEVVN